MRGRSCWSISAGNEGTMVSSPGNCPGVAAMAAIRHAGSKVGFSSLGPEVTMAAPGGNCVNINGGPCLFSLDTTSNSGTTVPATHLFTTRSTATSAPVSRRRSSRESPRSCCRAMRTFRPPRCSRAFAKAHAPSPPRLPMSRTFQTCHVPVNDQDFQVVQCLCTTSTCGAGMANAANSVDAADRPIAAIALARPSLLGSERIAERIRAAPLPAVGRWLRSHGRWSTRSPIRRLSSTPTLRPPP